MKQISWCKEQKNGIKLIEPSDNLSEEYLNNAEDSMKVLRHIYPTQSTMWLATTKYYIEYFAVYSILMKIGIKCEIHDCTLSLIKLLEEKGLFEKGTYGALKKDKELRIDNQYYLKNKEVEIDFEKLSNFLLMIRKILNNLNKDNINKIRKLINSF